jgi:hypothetical protein
MAFVEDFRPYLADFGRPAALDGRPVRVIFDSPYREGFDGMATAQPTAQLASADTAALTQASLLVIDGTTYRVTSVQPDGTGWTTLMLEKRP